MITTIILIISFLGIYYTVLFIRDYEKKQQDKNDPIKRQSLQKYLTKKHLFLQYNSYLYNKIEQLGRIEEFSNVRSEIEKDFPNYGDGIFEEGIVRDFIEAGLIRNSREKNKSNVRLGETFHTVSIAYPNFLEFCKEEFNSKNKIRRYKGWYYTEFGDDIMQKVVFMELNNSRFFMGLSKGGELMREYDLRNNIKTDKSEMYLFFELQVNRNPPHSYPYFKIMKLRKDVPVEHYKAYFDLNLKVCNEFIPK